MSSESVLYRPKIANNISELIGATPIVRLGRLARENGVVANILLKLESLEPCRSVKDRIAKSMIEEAEKCGDIIPGETILVEPTSGNTGIGLAMVGISKGYEVSLVMVESYSIERRVVLKALGAKVVLTPADKGVDGVFAKTNEIKEKYGNKAVILHQFNNPDNPKAHRETTGPEIWEQTDGLTDILVAGVGTGGTLTGVSQFLRSVKPDIHVVAVEPEESAVLSGDKPGIHRIQGIGAGFIPNNCDTSLINEVQKVSSESAISFARQLAAKEGILVGFSSGAAVAAAIAVGQRTENKDKNIVVIIPSFGERYLSTALFADLHAESMAQIPEPVELF